MTRFCAHCRLKHATDTWRVNACADGRPNGTKPRVVQLCSDCDRELNRLVLQFCNVRGVDKIMAAYRPPSEVEA